MRLFQRIWRVYIQLRSNCIILFVSFIFVYILLHWIVRGHSSGQSHCNSWTAFGALRILCELLWLWWCNYIGSISKGSWGAFLSKELSGFSPFCSMMSNLLKNKKRPSPKDFSNGEGQLISSIYFLPVTTSCLRSALHQHP